MNTRQATTGGERRRRRRVHRKTSSTGTGLDDYAPSGTSRFIASYDKNNTNTTNVGTDTPSNRRRQQQKHVVTQRRDVVLTPSELGYETMDDIGVSGIKPRVRAVRDDDNNNNNNDENNEILDSSGKSTILRGGGRRRMSLVAAGSVARRGIQEKIRAAEEVASIAKLKTADIVGNFGNSVQKEVPLKRRSAWKTRVTSETVLVAIRVQCRNLSSRTMRQGNNAFCVLWQIPSGYTAFPDDLGRPCRHPRLQEREVGRTEVIHNSNCPIFSESIFVEFKFEVDQWLILRIYDQDLQFSHDLIEHDYIGGYLFQLGDLLSRPAHRQIHKLDPETDALVVVKGRELDTSKKFLDFRIAAHNLKTIDRVMSLTDPYYMLERWNEAEGKWLPVWKSEVVLHEKNPAWDAASLSLTLLCGDDINETMRVTFWESYTRIEDAFLGYTEISIRDFINTPEDGQRVPILNRRKVLFGAATKLEQRGTMQVMRAYVKEKTTFLQYIEGGCELGLIFAIDCGATVDHMNEKKAVNFIHGKME